MHWSYDLNLTDMPFLMINWYVIISLALINSSVQFVQNLWPKSYILAYTRLTWLKSLPYINVFNETNIMSRVGHWTVQFVQSILDQHLWNCTWGQKTLTVHKQAISKFVYSLLSKTRKTLKLSLLIYQYFARNFQNECRFLSQNIIHPILDLGLRKI